MAITSVNIASHVRLAKPSLTNLPYDLGRRIFEEMGNAKKPDFTDAREEVEEVKQRII